MSPLLVFTVIAIYFSILIITSILTSRKSDTASFFLANRKAPWYLIAFGMIGVSLSGVTFISVPGEVGNSNFGYFQMVLGYIPGYLVIGAILMPLYYRLNLVSIYTYLNQRFGIYTYKTGSALFILSKAIGAGFRFYIFVLVLQISIFDALHISIAITAFVTILVLWLYTVSAGNKTLVWTSTFQTFFMLLAVVISIFIVANELNFGFGEIFKSIFNHPFSDVFDWDWKSKNNFFKQFFAGAFIAIVMSGLDQDIMQKNLTCKNIKEAQKNMFWFTLSLIPVNLLFMSLGVLLYIFASTKGISLPHRSDELFPMLAIHHFSTFAGIVFLLGIIAAAFSSADSAITSLTTAFCVDFLKIDINNNDQITKKKRKLVHIGSALTLLIIVIAFSLLHDESVLMLIFKAAGYTYGPLLGFFAFGLFTKINLRDRYVPIIAVISPILTYIININSASWFNGYKFGFELLMVNGLLTFIGMWILSVKFNKTYL